MNRRELLKSFLASTFLMTGGFSFADAKDVKNVNSLKERKSNVSELSLNLSFDFDVKDVNVFIPNDKSNFPIGMVVKDFKVEGNSFVVKMTNQYYKDVVVLNVINDSGVEYPIRVDLSVNRKTNIIKRHVNTERVNKKINVSDNITLLIDQINSNGSNRLYLFEINGGRVVYKYRTYYDIDYGLISVKTDMYSSTNNIPFILFNDGTNDYKFFDSRFLIPSWALNSYLDFKDVSIVIVDSNDVSKIKDECNQNIKKYKASDLSKLSNKFKGRIISVEDVESKDAGNYVYIADRFLSDSIISLCQIDILTVGRGEYIIIR